MDDPFNWDVDMVVRELCSPDHPTWTWCPSPELPPSEQLEACLREQRVDGHTLLTYPNEPKLCDSFESGTTGSRLTSSNIHVSNNQTTVVLEDIASSAGSGEGSDDVQDAFGGLSVGIYPLSRPNLRLDEYDDWNSDDEVEAAHVADDIIRFIEDNR
ncbi:hypothetical protein F5Y16DRAFT_406340 [Xylariaceae sp. FL0255]|nr:hypothetical protein F5Y16DRAFT_406340 [Xylariaceae sp. FL0255]